MKLLKKFVKSCSPLRAASAAGVLYLIASLYNTVLGTVGTHPRALAVSAILLLAAFGALVLIYLADVVHDIYTENL